MNKKHFNFYVYIFRKNISGKINALIIYKNNYFWIYFSYVIIKPNMSSQIAWV